MRIAVTGGTGFIGSHLIERLVGSGHEVASIDRGKKTVQGISPSFSSAEVIVCDILESKKLIGVLSGFDCIMHLAGMSSTRQSVLDPNATNRVNVEGTINVLEAARANNIKKVIFASSSAVYGDHAAAPQKESEPQNPSNPYGLSKLMGEKYCNMYSENYGFDAVSLRPFNVYGPRQSISRGGVVANFMACAVKGTSPEIFGSGEILRDFTYVQDVVDAFEFAMQKSGKANRLSINIGTGKNHSLIEVLKMVEKISGKSLAPVSKGRIVGDAHQTLADISLAKKVLGWEPMYSLEKGLEKTYAWYKGHFQ